jgi:hypothetical protein
VRPEPARLAHALSEHLAENTTPSPPSSRCRLSSTATTVSDLDTNFSPLVTHSLLLSRSSSSSYSPDALATRPDRHRSCTVHLHRVSSCISHLHRHSLQLHCRRRRQRPGRPPLSLFHPDVNPPDRCPVICRSQRLGPGCAPRTKIPPIVHLGPLSQTTRLWLSVVRFHPSLGPCARSPSSLAGLGSQKQALQDFGLALIPRRQPFAFFSRRSRPTPY